MGTVAVHDTAANDGRAVAVGALYEPSTSGRQVVGNFGGIWPQLIQVDDVKVSFVTRCDDTAVLQSDGTCRVPAVSQAHSDDPRRR